MTSVPIRIAVICDRYDIGVPTPCGYLRLVLPLRRLQQRGYATVEFLTIGELAAAKPDCVIWQRLSLPNERELDGLIKFARSNRCSLVYDIDDDLLSLAEDHSDARAYVANRAIVERCIALADQVWVSTLELQRRYASLGHEVIHIPNRLDADLWSPARINSDRPDILRFLYFGTSTHRGDFKSLIEPAFLALRQRFGTRVSLDVAGVFHKRPEGAEWQLLQTPDQTYVYPVFARWLQSLAGYDCGLAPLLDTPFNRGKSNIKWLEYSAMGLATLAADLPPYREETKSGQDILLLPPTAEYFSAGMQALLDQPGRLAALKQSARSRSVEMLLKDDADMKRESALRSLLEKFPAWTRRATPFDHKPKLSEQEDAPACKTINLFSGYVSDPYGFNPDYYRVQNNDLGVKSDAELTSHYQLYGLSEGRCGTPYALREYFTTLIPGDQDVLEIGPFNSPVMQGKNVFYFDVLDREALIKRGASLGYNVEKTPYVHFVSPIGDLSVIDRHFDTVVSSHCIEHQADLIAHLLSVEKILKEGGKYYLIIPDKRYCFDHFLQESSLSEVVAAHMEERRVHSLRKVIEHRAFLTHNNSVKHWSGDHGALGQLSDAARNAADEWRSSGGDYIDVHAWQFTPLSFRALIVDLSQQGLIGLIPEVVFETPWGRFEFCAILRRP